MKKLCFLATIMIMTSGVLATTVPLTNGDFELSTQANFPTGFDSPYDVPGWKNLGTIVDSGIEQGAGVWWHPYLGSYSAFMKSGDGTYLLSDYTIQSGDSFTVSFVAKGWSLYANTPGATVTITLFYGTDPASNQIGTYTTPVLTQGDNDQSWTPYQGTIPSTAASVGQVLGISVTSSGPANSYANFDEVSIDATTGGGVGFYIIE